MEVRTGNAIKYGSQKHDTIRLAVLDMYIVNGNATLCYEIFRRAITGDDDYKVDSRNAAFFFKKEENVAYMEQRKLEIAKEHFEFYANKMNLDLSEVKQKIDKYYDVENLTPEELRVKNLTELEEIKNTTSDENLKTQIIKQQTDLMNAKRRDEEAKNTDKFIHYYLPYPGCTCYKNKKK